MAAGVAAVLALPLLGFRLADSPQGLSLDYRLSWVIYAAAAVFVGRLGLSLSAAEVRRRMSARVFFPAAEGRDTTRIAGAILVLLAAALPWLPFADRNLVDRASLILIYVMLGTGLNITVGLAGLLDLGYVAFYAVGAYSYALISQAFGLSFFACLPLTGLLAAGFGVMVGFPVLRLRGDYLAIVTLGFGQIMRVILVNWTEVTGGPNGISGIERPSFFGLPFAASVEGQTTFAQFFGVPFSPVQRIYFLYYLILVTAIGTALFVAWIRRLPLGRAFEALRENETACVSLGLNPTAIKLSAFALGAGIAGLAGSFFAARQGFISPESFTFTETAIILAIVVLGGMGSQLGIVAAAILLVGLPEWFRDLEEYRMVAFGAAMVLIMVWRPRGLSSRREPTLRLGRAPR
jgi:branched-chain amino acid transport system permease protein